MLDRQQDKLIYESLFGRAKDSGVDVAKHLNVGEQLYQALTKDASPGDLDDDTVDEIVMSWTEKQQWIPSDQAAGVSDHLGQYLKTRRDKDISAMGDAYGRSAAELPFSR